MLMMIYVHTYQKHLPDYLKRLSSEIMWRDSSASSGSISNVQVCEGMIAHGRTARIVQELGHRQYSYPVGLEVSACHLLACWFAEPISSTLKMEAICSSERSVETQRTTRRHIPEDDTIHTVSVCSNLQ
jgi:hypothetical protein